jgi:hypothetical protein
MAFDPDAYGRDSMRIAAIGSIVDKLRVALHAAEELERSGALLGDVWRSDEDWSRLGRVALLADEAKSEAMSRLAVDEHRWREHRARRLALTIVK